MLQIREEHDKNRFWFLLSSGIKSPLSSQSLKDVVFSMYLTYQFCVCCVVSGYCSYDSYHRSPIQRCSFCCNQKALFSLSGCCFRPFDCFLLGVLPYADKKEV